MFTPQDVNILKVQLPSGAIVEICKATHISRPTIYKFLSGGKVKSEFQLKIVKSALKLIEQDKIKTQKVVGRLKELTESLKELPVNK